MFFYIIVGVTAVGIGGMVFAASLLFQNGNDQIEDRLASLTQNGGRGVKADAAAPSLLKSPLDEVTNPMEELFSKFLNVRALLEQSGTNIKVAQLVTATLTLGGGAGAIAYVLLPWKSLALLAVLLVAPLPLTYVYWMRGRRLDKFGSQLPGALDLMGQALRAGQSLPSAIQMVGTQMAEPIGPEFNRAFEQQNLGVTISDSLKDMTERIPNLDLSFFATAVILQRQTGGDLAEILDKISGLTRERYQIRGMIQALTGEGRISGIVLLGLPPVLFATMLKLNYDYVMMLFEDPMGQKMLVGALILQLLGAYTIKKIIDIKV